MDLTEDEMETMVAEYEVLSEEEIEALVERGQTGRDAKDALVVSGSTTGCKLGSRAAEDMVKHSWENILALINMLAFMSGGEAFFIFARSDGNSMFDSRSFSTPKAKALFHLLTGAVPDDIALSLESFATSGIYPQNESGSQRSKRRKKEIGEKITGDWGKIMRENKKGHMNMRPLWAHYETKMVQPYGITLDGWPLKRPPGDWTALEKKDIALLEQALENGTLKWVKPTDEQLLKRAERYEKGRATRYLRELEEDSGSDSDSSSDGE